MDGFYIQLGMIALMTTALVGGLLNRRRLGKGIGERFIQFVGVTWLIGATVILTIADLIDGVAGTILGALAGYLFGCASANVKSRLFATARKVSLSSQARAGASPLSRSVRNAQCGQPHALAIVALGARLN